MRLHGPLVEDFYVSLGVDHDAEYVPVCHLERR